MIRVFSYDLIGNLGKNRTNLKIVDEDMHLRDLDNILESRKYVKMVII